jgi:two-component sensor histidine kinase
MAVVVGSLADIARAHTNLDASAVEHLKRLVAAWGVIADLCFSDLLLMCPIDDQATHFAVLAHARATTGQTLYPDDQVGRIISEDERPLVAAAWRTGAPQSGEIVADGVRVSEEVVPVRRANQAVGLLSRESLPSTGRRPSPLERTYLETAQALIRMVAIGAYPFPPSASSTGIEQGPRVGDGVLRLDAAGKITYASPNAVSAFHRLGVVINEGKTLRELGLDDSAVRTALTLVAPVNEELERRNTVVMLGVIPLVDSAETFPVVGALLLVRDVTELRLKERQLLSKDATIREIHHRVKNNLQTIASLLRLQGRRLTSPEAKVALEESERRIRSIALVHETLSRDSSEAVAFKGIVTPLVSMVKEGLVGPDTHIEFPIEGDPGELPAEIATPLAVVLTELLHNAVEHGYRRGEKPEQEGEVKIVMKRENGHLVVEVRDRGAGLPPGFDIERTAGLGLQIVRTLVRSELNGTISHFEDDATVARVEIPLHEPVV